MLDVGNGIEVVGDERSLANEVSCVKRYYRVKQE